MCYLQDFHTEFTKLPPSRTGRSMWRIEPAVFQKLQALAEKHGTRIEPHSVILFHPFEIGGTSNGTVELIEK